MKLIPIKEYRTLPPSRGEAIDEKEKEIIQSLETLELTEKDLPLQKSLEEKNILTISTAPLQKGLKLSTKSKIGVAQFTNFAVGIYPKFSNIDQLVTLIDYVYDLDLEIFPESEIQFDGERNLLSETIISSFIQKCKELLRNGMIKSYEFQEDNLPYLRGKLLLRQQIINDSQKKLLFACEHNDLNFNNLENQIVLFCLELSYLTTINNSRKKEIRRILGNFSDVVDHVEISLEDFKKIDYHQMNQHYKKIHELCKLIISSTQITDIYEQKTRFVNSFFVDMNTVFEKFVFKLFKEFYPLPCKEQQYHKSWITQKKKKIIPIITDILILNKERTKTLAVLDTKYKEDILDDLDQFAQYMRDLKLNEATAILPETPESYSDTIDGIQQDLAVHIRHINIAKTLEALLLKDSVKRKELVKKQLEKIIPVGNFF